MSYLRRAGVSALARVGRLSGVLYSRRARAASAMALSVTLFLVTAQAYLSYDLQNCGACMVGVNWLAAAFGWALLLFFVGGLVARVLLCAALVSSLALAVPQSYLSRRMEVAMMSEVRACPTKRVTEFHIVPPGPGALSGTVHWDCHPRLGTVLGLTFAQWSLGLTAFAAAFGAVVLLLDALMLLYIATGTVALGWLLRRRSRRTAREGGAG